MIKKDIQKKRYSKVILTKNIFSLDNDVITNIHEFQSGIPQANVYLHSICCILQIYQYTYQEI